MMFQEIPSSFDAIELYGDRQKQHEGITSAEAGVARMHDGLTGGPCIVRGQQADRQLHTYIHRGRPHATIRQIVADRRSSMPGNAGW